MTIIKPLKVLNITLAQANGVDLWSYTDPVTGDPYDLFYTWDLVVNLNSALYHSNKEINSSGSYTLLDVQVGDWIATGSGGAALKITSIDTVNSNTDVLYCKAEDMDRYNTFNFSGLNGVIPAGDSPGYIFEISEEGLPILGRINNLDLGASWQDDLIARFIHRNLKTKYISVYQPSHGFNIGDPIILNNDGSYSKAMANAEAARMIGIVTSVDIPNTDFFSYRPIGTVVENISPALPGAPGDVIYLGDGTTTYTAVRPTNNAKPVFIQVDATGTKGVLLQQGVVVEPSTTKNFLVVVDGVNTGATTFTLPLDSKEVIEMAINGVELRVGVEFTFNPVTHVVTIDPVEIGYGVEDGDELTFLYKN